MNAKNNTVSKETPTTRRFQALFDSGLLTDRDRTFLNSLLSSYHRSGSLTPGRRGALEQIEARVENAVKTGVSVDNEAQVRLESLLSSGNLDSWGSNFVSSLLSQVKVGRALSPAQLAHLSKIEDKAKDQAGFSASYDDAARALFARAINYYRSTSYFGPEISRFDADPNFVPSASTFDRMTNNRYFKKVLETEEVAAKFEEGQIVGLASTIGSTVASRTCLREIARSTGFVGDPISSRAQFKGIILVNDGLTVVSAVRGAKPYKVLFFGASKAVMVEERFLVRSK